MSNDLLPELVMPMKERQEISISDDVKVIEQPNLIEDDSPSEEEDLIPEPVKKQPLKNEEIFKTTAKADHPVVAPIQKKKRVLTEKQKEALAKGRAKAKITRERKKQERLQGLDEDKEIKELKTKKKKKDLETLRQDVDTPSSPSVKTAPSYGSKEEFDKAVNDAVMKGISGYDTLRKERKVKKKKDQAKELQEKKIFQDISRATRKPNPDDMWAECFR
jgi:hypothetical protein